MAGGATLLDDRLPEAEVASSPTIGRFRLPGTEPTIDAAIDIALRDAGFEVIEVSLPGWAAAHEAATAVLFGEALVVNEDLWRKHPDRLGPDLVERFTVSETIGPAELGDARAQREPWRSELAEVFGEVGVLALPTMLTFPPRLDAAAIGPNPAAPAISLSGHPTLALPVPSGGLMPASIQLVAPDHHESRLLATGARIEHAVAG